MLADLDLLVTAGVLRRRRSLPEGRKNARRRLAGRRGGRHPLGRAVDQVWRFRLHTLMAPEGTLRQMALASPREGEREVRLRLLGLANREGRPIVLGDKGYAGAGFETDACGLGATLVRPRLRDERHGGPHLAQCRASGSSRSFGPPRTSFPLERHGARTLRGLRVRIASRFLALAAAPR